MTKGVYHVIMAGGSGTRFWPVSRASRPKQFLSLVGDRPLLVQAFDRAAAMAGADNVFVAAGAAHREMVLAVLPSLDPSRFIEEPCARNTAPCVGLSALKLARLDPDGVLVMSPADHVYTRPAALQQALGLAVEAARAGDSLVTLGIRPARPETGYGYIELAGDREEAAPGIPEGVRRAARFVEKPDPPTATAYLSSGRHLWNSGIFIWRVRSILTALQRCAPNLWEELRKIDAALGGAEEGRVTAEAFSRMASISIDYAVLERAPDVLVVPADPGWSDVGSWDAAAELHHHDAAGNAVAGDPGAVLGINAKDCFVFGGDRRRLIALVGVQDLTVVDAGDALLICRKGESQSVRAVVEALKARGRDDIL